MTYMDIFNSGLMYVLVIIGIVSILAFSVFTLVRSYRRGLALGISKTVMKDTVKSSAVYSLVPSIAIIIGMFTLSTVIGIPWSWFRLSVVGSVVYELMAADMVATGAGFESIGALANANVPELVGPVMFVMSMCIMGGLVTVLIFGKAIQTNLAKFRKKNGPWGILATSSISLAMIVVFLPIQVSKGAVYVGVLLTSALVAFLHKIVIKKLGWSWLGNFIMADSLILGMASSLIWVKLFS